MQSKYHKIFLGTAQRLDDLTGGKQNIYHYSVDILDSFKPYPIRKLCEIIHRISQ